MIEEIVKFINYLGYDKKNMKIKIEIISSSGATMTSTIEVSKWKESGSAIALLQGGDIGRWKINIVCRYKSLTIFGFTLAPVPGLCSTIILNYPNIWIPINTAPILKGKLLTDRRVVHLKKQLLKMVIRIASKYDYANVMYTTVDMPFYRDWPSQIKGVKKVNTHPNYRTGNKIAMYCAPTRKNYPFRNPS